MLTPDNKNKLYRNIPFSTTARHCPKQDKISFHLYIKDLISFLSFPFFFFVFLSSPFFTLLSFFLYFKMSQQPHQPEIGLKKADIKQVNANQGVTILFESPPKKKTKQREREIR